MHEYGLNIEPEYPDEAYEALADVLGDGVFTRTEALECISDVMGVSELSTFGRFEKLARNGNIQEYF